MECQSLVQEGQHNAEAPLHVYLQALADVFGHSQQWYLASAFARSFNPCDIVFWDRLKDNVFNSNGRTKKENIPTEQHEG
jgi:hypothetical protein